LLVSHAVATYVTNEGAVLYIRGLKQTIFAPASAFPEPKQGATLPDMVELGRSVVARAVPADKFLDLQVGRATYGGGLLWACLTSVNFMKYYKVNIIGFI